MYNILVAISTKRQDGLKKISGSSLKTHKKLEWYQKVNLN